MPRASARTAGHEPALASELRSAIDESGANWYQLAKRAGIDESAVRKFSTRERSLSLDSAGRLADALGLRLVRPGKARKFPGAPGRKGPEKLRPPEAHDDLPPAEPGHPEAGVTPADMPAGPETLGPAGPMERLGPLVGPDGRGPADPPAGVTPAGGVTPASRVAPPHASDEAGAGCRGPREEDPRRGGPESGGD